MVLDCIDSRSLHPYLLRYKIVGGAKLFKDSVQPARPAHVEDRPRGHNTFYAELGIKFILLINV